MRPSILQVHRWISLIFAGFWALQAGTGIFLVFHWEIDDALLQGSQRKLDIAAIEAQIDAIENQGGKVGSLWESGGAPYRFDLYVDRPEKSEVLRIDGAGNILRRRSDGQLIYDGGWIDAIVLLHHNLLSGDRGSWIVGLSGILLFTNLAIGGFVAWPGKGRWRRAMLPRLPSRGTPGHAYQSHRALGLWVVVPAMLSVGSGVMLVFSGAIETLIAPEVVEAPPATVRDRPVIGLTAAVGAARREFPDTAVSGVSFPDEATGTYRIRLNRADDTRRVYGMTTVYVDAYDGRILSTHDPLTASRGRSFVDGLFPFHTGEMGGLTGRVAASMIGIWLLVMIWLGLALWYRRRRAR